MRILIGAVTKAEPEILRAHLESLQAQDLPEHVTVDYWYLADPGLSKESQNVFKELKVTFQKAAPKPEDAEYEISDKTHHWNKPTFYWLGKEKQRILDKGREFDAVFMVDSDLILDSGTLASLLSTGKDVVSGVFWTQWTPEMPSLPQVWMEHPYEMQGRGVEAHEHLRNAATRQLWEVAGLGACTLIRREVLDLVGFYPPLEGLPEDGMWQGEDRTFCIRASRNHVKLWADGWPSIYHTYRPGKCGDIQDKAEHCSRDRRDIYGLGDYVSARLTPVEEAGLAGWSYIYRGRLEKAMLAPSLVKALSTQPVGTDSFIQVKFPVWWPIPEYRNTTKTIRVELLDIRADTPHPDTEENQDFGAFYGT